MKVCFKCNAEKTYSEFYKHKTMADGYLGKCKECTKSDVSKHRDENLEKIREYDRNRPNKIERAIKQAIYSKTDKGKSVNRKAKANYSIKYPLKRQARIITWNAIRDGIIVSPNSCSNCRKIGKVEAHHDDYHKPLNVRWLCVGCHNAFHKQVRNVERGMLLLNPDLVIDQIKLISEVASTYWSGNAN